MDITPAVALMCLFLSHQDASETGAWIRVNQLGYLPHSTKVAVLSASITPASLTPSPFAMP